MSSLPTSIEGYNKCIFCKLLQQLLIIISGTHVCFCPRVWRSYRARVCRPIRRRSPQDRSAATWRLSSAPDDWDLSRTPFAPCRVDCCRSSLRPATAPWRWPPSDSDPDSSLRPAPSSRPCFWWSWWWSSCHRRTNHGCCWSPARALCWCPRSRRRPSLDSPAWLARRTDTRSSLEYRDAKRQTHRGRDIAIWLNHWHHQDSFARLRRRPWSCSRTSSWLPSGDTPVYRNRTTDHSSWTLDTTY